MKKDLKYLLKEKFFGDYFYAHHFEDIQKIFINFSYIDSTLHFSEKENYLFCLFQGNCKISYNNIEIVNGKFNFPFIFHEHCYFKVLKNGEFPPLFILDKESDFFGILIDFTEYDKLSVDLKVFFAEKIFLDFMKKINIINLICEKFKKINEKIENFIISDDKEISIGKFLLNIADIIKSKKIEKAHVHKYFNDNEIVNLFLKKSEIKKRYTFLKRYIIPKIPALSILPDNLIFQIANKGKWIKFYNDDIIFAQNEISDGYFYIVIDGDLDIVVNGKVIARLSGCNMIGEMSLLQKPGDIIRRTATVVAKSKIYAIKVHSKFLSEYNLKYKLKFYNSLLFQFMKRLEEAGSILYKEHKKIKEFLDRLKKSNIIPVNKIISLENLIFKLNFNNFLEF